MRACLLLLVMACVLNNRLTAGGGNVVSGARAVSMGGATVALEDVWAVAYNPAAMAWLDQFELGLAYDSRLFLPEAALKSIAFMAPLGQGSVGFTGNTYGYAGFTDSRLALSYGLKLSEWISLGVQMNLLHIRAGDVYGQRSAVTAAVGATVKPVEKLSMGMMLYNPTRTRLTDYDDERIPTQFTLGVGYTFSKQVMLTFQMDKDLLLPVNFRAGIEYSPAEQILLRTGFSTLDRSFAFGVGYVRKRVEIHISNQWSQWLGHGATASFGFNFGQRKSSE